MALSEAFLAWEQETQRKWLQEGRQEKEIEIARNLLQQGIAIAVIAQATGLSIAQLQELQAQINSTDR